MRTKRVLSSENNRFKQIRLDENLTQQEFGAKLGKTQGAIQKYETGALEVPWEVIKKLNKVFKITFDWYHTGKGSKKVTNEKTSLIKDVGTINTNYEMVEQRVKKLEETVTKLVRDFYAKKHNTD